MGMFQYVAKDAGGRIVRSSLDADSRHAALADLRGDGLTVVDLFAVDSVTDSHLENTIEKEQGKARAAGRRRIGTRLRRGDLAIFCRQMAIAVNAGVPIREALESILDDMEHGRLHLLLRDVVRRLHEGEPFSMALARHQGQLGPLFVALIRAAEESGSMPQTLNQLSVYLERSERLARKIRSITAYPLFVIVFFSIVCFIMTVFILPEFEDIFGGFDSNLPPLTRLVFGFNRFILDNVLWIICGVLALVGAFLMYRRTRVGRMNLDRLKLKLPFFGMCIRLYSVARFSRNLSIMLKGGVPVTMALEITAAVSGNLVLERALLNARDCILNGMDISSSLARDPSIPRLVIRMAGIGENSGKLPEVLEKISDSYEDQVEGAIMVATSLFEPLIICVFGAMVLVLVLAIYMPIFTVAAGVK